MKVRIRILFAAVIGILTVEGIGWLLLNCYAVIATEENQAVFEIVAKYVPEVKEGEFSCRLLSISNGDKNEKLNDYLCFSEGREIAVVSVKSFLGMGWQELRYERK